jgi:lactoylglutathione lyase
MMFRHISAAVLFVQDFEKSLMFYRDTLGLPIAVLESKFAAFQMDNQDFAINHITEAAKMVNLPLEAFEAQSGKADRVMLCADVENVDAEYERLKAKGVEFTKAPVDQPWGIRAAYFRDPEGNIWEIKHPLQENG